MRSGRWQLGGVRYTLLFASVVSGSLALCGDAMAQASVAVPHAIEPPVDTPARDVAFHVEGGPHSITILPRSYGSGQWSLSAHAADCSADCILRLAPGGYLLVVGRLPEGPSYARNIAIRPDSTRVEASSPHALEPAMALGIGGAVVFVAGLVLLADYGLHGPFDGAPLAVPSPPDVRLLYAGLSLAGAGVVMGVTGMVVTLVLRPRVHVLGGTWTVGASPLAGGGFVGGGEVRF